MSEKIEVEVARLVAPPKRRRAPRKAKPKAPAKQVALVYVGQLPVEVRPWSDPEGGRQVVEPGGVFTTDADHAAGLLSQGPTNWRLASDKR